MSAKGAKAPLPIIPTAVLPGLVDIVRMDDPPDSQRVFLFQDATTAGSIESKEKGELLVPAGKDDAGWLPPKHGAVLAAYNALKRGTLTTETLFRQVRNKLESYCHLPDPALYDVLSAWVIHTYRMDWWQRTPIVMLYGPPDTGKNQIGGVMTYLSYRGEDHGMLTAANVFRGAQLLNSTLFFDVSRLNIVLRKDGLDEVLIKRTQAESTVRRVVDPSLADLRGQRTFRPWGCTIIATNEVPASVLFYHDLSSFQRRRLTLIMRFRHRRNSAGSKSSWWRGAGSPSRGISSLTRRSRAKESSVGDK